MLKNKFLCLTLFCLAACHSFNKEAKESSLVSSDSITTPQPLAIAICDIEQSFITCGLVKASTPQNKIKVNLRYASDSNFLKTRLYPACLTNAYLQPIAAQMLTKAQQELSILDSTKYLLVWDAARPVSVQQKMWDALKLPIAQRVKFVSNPKNHSIHNYGCAVDITICDARGTPLDMGTDFDDFGQAASIRNMSSLVEQGLLTTENVANRQLLHKVMKNAGFSTIHSEWWHFNAMSRSKAKELFTAVP